MSHYLNILVNVIPLYVYEILLAFLCVGIILVAIFKRKKTGRWISILLLLVYTALIYCSTVIYRVVWGISRCNLTPFWSYNKPELLVENIMNTLLFVPLGLLLSLSYHTPKWWKVLLIGVSISVSIEVLQFFLRRGFSEVDDVMHNSLGCMIGFGLYTLVRYGSENICKSSVGALVET